MDQKSEPAPTVWQCMICLGRSVLRYPLYAWPLDSHIGLVITQLQTTWLPMLELNPWTSGNSCYLWLGGSHREFPSHWLWSTGIDSTRSMEAYDMRRCSEGLFTNRRISECIPYSNRFRWYSSFSWINHHGTSPSEYISLLPIITYSNSGMFPVQQEMGVHSKYNNCAGFSNPFKSW